MRKSGRGPFSECQPSTPALTPPPLITLDRAERGKTPRYLAVPVYCRGICRHFAILVGTKEQNCPAPPIHTQTTCLTLFHYSIGLVTPCCTVLCTRAGHATILLRQRDYVLRPHNCLLLQYYYCIFGLATQIYLVDTET